MTHTLPESTRFETFADGVFAIAITLLVIEIKVPTHEEVTAFGGLWPALLRRWPSYLGYLISFFTLGIMWVNHHAIFQYVRRVDRRFLLVNVLFLMGIAFVPFPTAVLAEHLPEAHERLAAVMFYGAVLVVIALLFNAVWWAGIGAGGRLLGPAAHAEGVETISRRYRLGPALYLAALALAFITPWLTLAVHAALALLWALPERTGV